MSLPAEVLAAISSAIAGYEIAAPSSDRLIRLPPAAMLRLQQLHKATGDLAETAPEILAHPEVAKALEQELTRIIVQCLIDVG